MLDLQAGVHLHKEEIAAGVEQKLHSPGANIADGACGGYRRLAHRPTQFGRQAGRRRLFHHLLVAALDRTVALGQIHRVAVLVGKHLNLDVARLQHVFFHQHARIAEGGLRLTLGRRQRLTQLRLALDHLHALAAATGRGLEQHRIANLGGFDAEGLQRLIGAVIPGHQRHPGGVHQSLGRRLAAHGINRAGGRADEDQPGGVDRAGEIGILGEKAVAGVNRLGTGGLCRGDNRLNPQITLARPRATQVDRLIGAAHVQGVAVGIAVYRHGGDTQLARGAHDAAGNFAAVGNQQGINHGSRTSRVGVFPGRPTGPPDLRG